MPATVLPLARARGTGDEEHIFEGLTDVERAAKILEHEFPQLAADIGMLVARPFRLVFDPTVGTASTDCLAEVRISPHFFLEGFRDVGYGTAYHESGHIRTSPYGAKLLARAEREGGPVLRHLLNLILDRKDDFETAAFAPGFAPLLRERLTYICTMTRRKFLEGRGLSPAQVTVALKGWKPQDPYEDFFFAAKWHKSPRTPEGARAMKYCTRRRLLAASPDVLFWTAKRVREVLGEKAEEDWGTPERVRLEQLFLALIAACGLTGCGHPSHPLDPKIAQLLQTFIVQFVAGNRKTGLDRLRGILSGMGVVWPGPVSVGVESKVPVTVVAPDPANSAVYQELLAPVAHLVDPLVARLRRVDHPSEYTLYGQDEGDLDLDEAAAIACRLGGYYTETVVERDIDAEVHLAIDCSGSMTGEKVKVAKQIGIAFSEGIKVLAPAVEGHLWAFSSKAIYDLGPPNPNSGIVGIEGEAGNSDTHMLVHVGRAIARSRHRRRVLLVLCDDGPDSIEDVRKLSQQLMARGIIVIHLLVGVHGTPDIYPIELPYTSMEECLAEFGDLLEEIIRNLK